MAMDLFGTFTGIRFSELNPDELPEVVNPRRYGRSNLNRFMKNRPQEKRIYAIKPHGENVSVSIKKKNVSIQNESASDCFDSMLICPPQKKHDVRVKSRPSFKTFEYNSKSFNSIDFAASMLYGGSTVSPLYLWIKYNKISTLRRIPFSQSFVNNISLMHTALLKSENVFQLELKSLIEINFRIKEFKLSSTQRILFVSSVLLVFIKLGIKPHLIVDFFTVISMSLKKQCVNVQSLDSIEPHIVIAPPGVGKTTFEFTYSLGYLDTDFIPRMSDGKMDPSVLQCMIDNGLSIISNTWEYQTLTCLKFAVIPNDLQHRLNLKHIYPQDQKGIHVLKSKQRFFKDKIGRKRQLARYNQEEWIAAYSDLPQMSHIFIGTGQFIEEGIFSLFTSLVHSAHFER